MGQDETVELIQTLQQVLVLFLLEMFSNRGSNDRGGSMIQSLSMTVMMCNDPHHGGIGTGGKKKDREERSKGRVSAHCGVVPCNTTLRIVYQDCHVGRWLCGFIIAVKVVTILWMIR